MFHADETQFSVILDSGHTFEMKGDTEIKYIHEGSGDMVMTMMDMLGGESKPRFGISFILFQNERCSHPIKSVSNTIFEVWYRSGSKRWMDTRVFEDWLS